MTTEIEKQFFDTFGIKPKELIFRTMNCACGCHDCKNCNKYKNNFQKTYPQITDRILLELICILTRWHLDKREPYEIMSINIEQLKNQILNNSLYIAKHLKAKQQVQELFKEDI